MVCYDEGEGAGMISVPTAAVVLYQKTRTVTFR